jgi:EpsI family protein
MQMRDRGMTVRLFIVVFMLLGGTVLLHAMSHGEAVAPRQSLAGFPNTIGSWTGTETPLDAETLQVLGLTDYASREYFSSTEFPVSLYIGYYASQRTGDTIHSPKNCLPGAGWDPIYSGDTTIPVAGGQTIKVNEYVIAKGLQKQLVFYWYQGRGRVVANEYWGKFWMIHDAITRNRTDGALVRVITPIGEQGEAAAHARLEKFAQLIWPSLGEFIPN